MGPQCQKLGKCFLKARKSEFSIYIHIYGAVQMQALKNLFHRLKAEMISHHLHFSCLYSWLSTKNDFGRVKHMWRFSLNVLPTFITPRKAK